MIRLVLIGVVLAGCERLPPVQINVDQVGKDTQEGKKEELDRRWEKLERIQMLEDDILDRRLSRLEEKLDTLNDHIDCDGQHEHTYSYKHKHKHTHKKPKPAVKKKAKPKVKPRPPRAKTPIISYAEAPVTKLPKRVKTSKKWKCLWLKPKYYPARQGDKFPPYLMVTREHGPKDFTVGTYRTYHYADKDRLGYCLKFSQKQCRIRPNMLNHYEWVDCPQDQGARVTMCDKLDKRAAGIAENPVPLRYPFKGGVDCPVKDMYEFEDVYEEEG